MKTKRHKPTNPASVREAETAWPLLTAYLDLAERHAELLAERVERTRAELVQLEAERTRAIKAKLAATLDEVEAAIMAAPAPKIFNSSK